jgi:UDP-2,4-diacetamido-2,4,6-trideoxy-beta-L-altropyranose hydrolase
MRCLTLAAALRVAGAQCYFICREHPGNLIAQIRQRGFAVSVLPAATKALITDELAVAAQSSYIAWLGADWTTDAAETKVGIGETAVDWLVVDHYSIGASWEKVLRPMCRGLMVIDDLADRQHDCDLLLDQNYYRNQGQRYQGLLPEQCVTLLGPSYVLLRPEFDEARRQLRVRDGIIKRILVFFGGSDLTNQTEMALTALEQLNRQDISVDVVVGLTNPNRHSIQTLCDRLPYATYHCNVSNMAELILNADLGIGAGGSAMWERCFLGLPTITVVLADNQVRTTEDVAGLGAIEYLGWSDSLEIEDYARAVSDAIANPKRVEQISDAALGVLHEETTTAVVDAMRNLLQPSSAKLSTDDSPHFIVSA